MIKLEGDAIAQVIGSGTLGDYIPLTPSDDFTLTLSEDRDFDMNEIRSFALPLEDRTLRL
ncbi:MAG: hypothetical protein FVQ79_00670 [Planctomycetes bacterium]|nr:hypothetical protein [Planctomycetota bacterium]